MMSKPDHSALLKRIAEQNDQQAYRELFDYFYQPLYQFALTYLKSSELAEEAVSDVLIKIWKKRAGLPRIHNLKLYLFTSTKNAALNYLRRQNGRALQPDQYQVQLQSVYFDPEKLMLTAEMLKRIQAAIRQLPPRCQLIFKLVKEEGLKYREVAELLELSVKTVENQMAIALGKIGHAIQFDIHTTLASGR